MRSVSGTVVALLCGFAEFFVRTVFNVLYTYTPELYITEVRMR